MMVNENEAAGLIPSLNVSETVYDPRSEVVGLIV